MLDVLHARDIPFSTKITVFLTAQLEQIITERPVSFVSPHKSGMVLNVLTDVPMEESGALAPKLVSAQPVNSGTGMPVSSVPAERPGAPTLKAANAQSHQPGTELAVLSVLGVEFTTTPPTNANVQLDRLTMDMSAQ